MFLKQNNAIPSNNNDTICSKQSKPISNAATRKHAKQMQFHQYEEEKSEEGAGDPSHNLPTHFYNPSIKEAKAR